MAGKKDSVEKTAIIRCHFENGLHTPQKCVSCNAPITDNKIDVVAFSPLHTSKVIFKFPVCEKCRFAYDQYINIKPIIIWGSIALLFSIFTIFYRPGYLNLPENWFLIGGITWLAILTGFITWSVIRAKKQNLPEIIQSKKDLDNSIKPIRLITPRKYRAGEVVFRFRNLAFAQEFKKLNKDQVIT